MKLEQLENTNNRTKILDRIIRWLGVLGTIIGLLLALFYINTPNSKLEIKVITNTSLIEIKEDFLNLNIIYDSINFIKEEKNISVTILEIKNNGNKSISLNDYDSNIYFGFKFENADLIKQPEIIKSSDYEYFKDAISHNEGNIVVLKHKIIDPEEFFQIKLYSIHDKNLKPLIKSSGKVLGQKTIEIIDEEKVVLQNLKDENALTRTTTILSIALITVLSLLTLSLYKNNNIRMETNRVLIQTNQELLEEIEKHKKSKKP